MEDTLTAPDRVGAMTSGSPGRLPLPVGIGSPEDLAKLPNPLLIDMYNSIPGVKAVTKLTNRVIAVARVWKAFTGEEPPRMAVAKKDKAPKAGKTAKTGATSERKTGGGKKGATHPVTPRQGTKRAEVIRLMSRKNGVKLSELMETMKWQAHTVRGFVSTISKREKLKIESFVVGDERAYRLEQFQKEDCNVE